MNFLIVFLLSLAGSIVGAQDSWKVCLDKKVLLTTSTEDVEKNIINISSEDLKKNKSLVVSYKQVAPQKGWERSISIYTEKDEELQKQKGKNFVLKTSELKKLLEKNKRLKIFTTYLPTDPKMKAQIRVRRVHLCTLVLQS